VKEPDQPLEPMTIRGWGDGMRWPKVALVAGAAALGFGFLQGPVSAALASRPGPSSAPAGPASLTITITSLPPGDFANVTVTGPDFYFLYVPHSATLRYLVPGVYVVHAGPVRVRSGVQYPVAPEVSVQLQPGSKKVVQVNYADTIPATTKVAAASSVTGLSGSPGGPETVTLSSLPSGGLAVGDVLAIGMTPATPDGLLGKVTAFSSSGTGYSVSTVPATLEEAMPDGVIDPSWTEPPESEPLDVGDLSCGASASLSVTDSLTLTPGFDFAAQWGNNVPTSATFEASGTLTQQLQAAVAGSAGCSLDDVPLVPRIYFPRFEIPVAGFLPVIVRPFVEFDLSAQVSTNASLTEGETATATATAGLQYANGQLTPTSSFTTSFTPQAPTPQLQADMSVAVGPKFGLVLEGIAGPDINLDGTLDLDVAPLGSPVWTLSGGLEAGGGLDIPLLDLNVSKPDILTYSVDLDTSAPVIQTTSLPAGTAGTAYSQTLTASTGTPPYTWSVSSGSLPPGLSLDPTTGVVSGTPTQPGSFSFTAQVADSSDSILYPKGQTATQSESITIGSPGPPSNSPSAQPSSSPSA
jgi:hypothetical protein